MKDYLFDSARIRTLEAGLIGRERLEVLLAANTLSDTVQRLSEMGVTVVNDPESGRLLREETLLAILRTAYAQVVSASPDDKALCLWLYPYDCNNVKAAIKGFFRGIDPRPMMFDFGTVDVERAVEMVQSNDFSELPQAMRQAASEAMASFAKSRDPQRIDLILDAACYADMLSAGESSGVKFAVRLVRARIDLTNVLTAVRVLRMKSGELGKLLLRDALIAGGEISVKELTAWCEDGEETLWERLRYGVYGKLSEAVGGTEAALREIERGIDHVHMELIREAKFAAYGAEVLIGYLLAREYEVKNLRILLAGRELGLSTETIRERMRDTYV